MLLFSLIPVVLVVMFWGTILAVLGLGAAARGY